MHDVAMVFVTRVRNGRVEAVNPSKMKWEVAGASWLLRTGNLFKMRPPAPIVINRMV